MLTRTFLFRILTMIVSSLPMGNSAKPNNQDLLSVPPSTSKTDTVTDNCFNSNGTSTFMRNLTNEDSTNWLHQIQHHGCMGTPAPTDEQNQMLTCCAATESEEMVSSMNHEMSSACSNLNFLGITQSICSELSKNEHKYHSEFKNLLKSKKVQAILGVVHYLEFHKTMVAIIYQHAVRVIQEVEFEIGFENDLTEEYIRNTTKCLF